MKNKLHFYSLEKVFKGVLVAVVFAASFFVFQPRDVKNSDFSLSLLNSSAQELPTVDIHCNTGGSGKCYTMVAKSCYPFTGISYSCQRTGITEDSCNGLLVLICNMAQ